VTIPIPAAAIAANVTTRTIRRWIAAGMPSHLVNNQRLINLDDLHGWALRMSQSCHSLRDNWADCAQESPATERGFAIWGPMEQQISAILADYDLDPDDREAIAQRIVQAMQPRPERTTRVIGPPETR
jgi:hypothetical protein